MTPATGPGRLANETGITIDDALLERATLDLLQTRSEIYLSHLFGSFAKTPFRKPTPAYSPHARTTVPRTARRPFVASVYVAAGHHVSA
jgi:hypothetical protein